MILRQLPVRVEEYQILESFTITGKRYTVMKFCAICWFCFKTGIHKLTQCELSRCSWRFFAERKHDKLRSTVLGWTLSREGYCLFAAMEHMISKQKFHTFSYTKSVIVTSFIIPTKYQRTSWLGHWSFNLGIRDLLNILDANTSWKNYVAVNMMTSRPLLLRVQLFFASGRDSRFSM